MSPLPVRWTRRARRDLVEIGRFIAAESRPAARRWVARLKARASEAAQAPLAGRRVPEMGRDDIREVFEGSYRLVYRVRAGAIDVLTVFEGHRHRRLRLEPPAP